MTGSTSMLHTMIITRIDSKLIRQSRVTLHMIITRIDSRVDHHEDRQITRIDSLSSSRVKIICTSDYRPIQLVCAKKRASNNQTKSTLSSSFNYSCSPALYIYILPRGYARVQGHKSMFPIWVGFIEIHPK